MRDSPLRCALAWMVMASTCVLCGAAWAAGEPPRDQDAGPTLDQVKRTIGKQPDYVGQPQYALAVFGKQTESSMWLVLDKSTTDASSYDVLYIDLNGDGDLIESSERLTRNGADSRFTLDKLVDPKTGIEHSDFSLRVSGGSLPTHMLSLRWRGKHKKIGGGYPIDPDDGYMAFAESTEKAPIIWFNGDGPFRFQPWYNDELDIGGSTDLKLFLGQQGSGPSSFCAFQEHVLPDGEFVVATLIYTDQEGQQKEATCNLDLRC